MSPATVYDAVGGEQFFVDLVDRFYVGVAADPMLRPMYPDDLTDSKVHLWRFLVQYWGGPTTYSDERGHPRLRMRHAPFVIDQAARDAWFTHMSAALDAAEVSGDVELQMRSYFSMAADAMVNQES
ncbi:MAG TPA: globin [Acidimicrobiales bacterium]|nr:globin [Acidimicrobiales bacterium]